MTKFENFDRKFFLLVWKNLLYKKYSEKENTKLSFKNKKKEGNKGKS